MVGSGIGECDVAKSSMQASADLRDPFLRDVMRFCPDGRGPVSSMSAAERNRELAILSAHAAASRRAPVGAASAGIAMRRARLAAAEASLVPATAAAVAVRRARLQLAEADAPVRNPAHNLLCDL